MLATPSTRNPSKAVWLDQPCIAAPFMQESGKTDATYP